MAAREARLLRVPREPRRAVGRPRGARLHRRDAHRRDARSQRPPPGEVRRHRAGARRPRERARRPRHRRRRTSSRKGRLQPGKMFLVDTAKGRIVDDEEIKTQIATRKPYAQWIAENKIELAQLPTVDVALLALRRVERERLQRAFGYTREDLRVLLAADGDERRRAHRAAWATTRRSRSSAIARRRSSATSSSSSRR